MAKRFFTVFFVTLGIALLCVTFFVLVLFLAPGFSVLGLRYVATGTHVIDKSYVIEEMMPGSSYSGSIRVEVDDVPVSFCFSHGFEHVVEYYDNYNGLTNSKFDNPSISFSKDDDGTAVIKVKSFNTFIYENGNSQRHLIIYIPGTEVDGTAGEDINLTVVSKRSPVSFYKEDDDNYELTLNSINLKTSGKVNVSTDITVDTYKYETMNSIEIKNTTTNSINATNYILNSTNGKIVVNKDVAGTINAKTNNASIKIKSCKDFIAESGWGDISCSKSDSDIEVSGKVNINTTAGSIKLGSITGEEQSVIKTKTGAVSIKNAKDVKIRTTRGRVNVKSARNLDAKTSTGRIDVETISQSVQAESKYGRIYLGGSSNVLVNPTVKSTFGDVFVYSASGIVNIETDYSDVVFNNTNSNDIQLEIGGALKATKVTGSVEITVSGNAEIKYSEFTDDSTLNLNGSSSTIEMLSNKEADFAYNLEGKKVTFYEYNSETDERFKASEGSEIASEHQVLGQKLLTVKSKGNVIIYVAR